MRRRSIPFAVSVPALVISLSAPAGGPTVCIDDSSEVVVEHRRFAEGPPAYVFRVTNRSTASVYVLVLGEGEGPSPSLPASTSNVPTSIGTPDGWKGRHVIDKEAERMQYVWTAEDVLARIRPTTSLSGFTVQLPLPKKKERGELDKIPFRVFLADGTCHAGRVAPDA